MKKNRTSYDNPSEVGRRDFFGQLFRELARPVVEFNNAVRGESKPDEPAPEAERFPDTWLRPPSVRDEWAFLATCDRSGECVRACPAHAIRLLPEDAGRVAGTPYIDPNDHPCVVCTDLACMSACPSGALTPRPATDLGMGIARVNPETCVRSQGEDCRLCVEGCPLHDLGLTVLDIPLSGQVFVYEDLCVGCGCCQRACPTDPKAIQVEPIRVLGV